MKFKKKFAAFFLSAAAVAVAAPAVIPSFASAVSRVPSSRIERQDHRVPSSSKRATGSSLQQGSDSSTSTDTGQDVVPDWQAPAPWIQAHTMKQARKVAGFGMKAPSIKGYKPNGIYIMNRVIQKEYIKGDLWILLKKGKGSGDLSGDHETYPAKKIIKAGKYKVKVRGNRNRYYKATWTKHGFSYSIGSGSGLTLSQIKTIAQGMK